MEAEGLAGVVRGFQAGLAGGLSMGVTVLGVIATAAVIPDLLEQGNIGLHLSKPVARWELLLGKYLGAIAVVLLNVLYFLGAVWLIFGIKVGVWNIQVLLSAFTLCYMFACLYSLVVLLGVTFRNTAISILGAFLYLFVVGALLHNRATSLYLVSSSQVYRGLVDVFYYLLPELSGIQENITRQIINTSLDWKPFAQSLLSGCGLLAVSAFVFHKQDF
jgi:ABC-type transport system involved in multi-copper enzyme maturation permease subunit